MFCDGSLTPHHIGYAVLDIEDSKRTFELLGFSAINEQHSDSLRNVNIQFMKNNAYMIELIAIADICRHSDMNFLIKNGRKFEVTPYHVCFEVDDLEEAMAELREKRFVLSAHPAPAPAMRGRLVAFMYHRNTGLIELLERECHVDKRPE